jgi:hypothetical protein
MVNDPIVSEIHQFREQLLAQYQGDFAAYFAALLAKQSLHPEQYAAFAVPPVDHGSAVGNQPAE